MKFIAGLLVWGNGGMGKTSQVFPRFRGSANHRVDLHLPLIVSIYDPFVQFMDTQLGARQGRRTPIGIADARDGAIDGRLYFWVDVDHSHFFDSRHGSILGFRTGFHPGRDSPDSARRRINNRDGLLILFT